MQTLFTIEDIESGSIKTLLHVSTVTETGTLAVVVYTSDEMGNHVSTESRTFTHQSDQKYHDKLRKQVKKMGGIIHRRISDTPLPKSKQREACPGRDTKGRFIKKNNNEISGN